MARRIVSLLPGATEMVAALGLADRLVGVSHGCDHPEGVRGLPVVTETSLPSGLADAAGIDRAVAAAAAEGRPLDRVRLDVLRDLEPDLVITQSLCAVCAVDGEAVEIAVGGLPSRPDVLALSPGTLDGVLEALLVVGAAAGEPGRAADVVEGLRRRLARVAAAVDGAPVPRVVCLEWIDPPFAAGHWLPDQVAAAGGREAVGASGVPSRRIDAAEVEAAGPEVVILAPCGLPAEEAARGAEGLLAGLAATPAVREGRVAAVDASALTSRPGPRLVDGVEAIAAVLHPGRVALPADPGAVQFVLAPRA